MRRAIIIFAALLLAGFGNPAALAGSNYAVTVYVATLGGIAAAIAAAREDASVILIDHSRLTCLPTSRHARGTCHR